MSEKVGLINEYVCTSCGGITRTINRDEGTTPFMIGCRANNIGCGEMAHSLAYPASAQQRVPGWEWIKPSPEEFEQYLKARPKESEFRDSLQDHVNRGGMLLIKLDACGRERYGFKLRRA